MVSDPTNGRQRASRESATQFECEARHLGAADELLDLIGIAHLEKGE